MPFAKVNNVELYYEEVGQGAPLVLLHGGWSDVSAWAEQVPAFSQKYRTIPFDRRGCGQSTKVAEVAHSPDLWVEDLRQLLQHLNASPAYLCGSSYGGMIVLEFLLKHQEMCRAAVLVSTTSGGYRAANPPIVPFSPRTPELSSIRVPTLIVQGEIDTAFPPSHGQGMKDGIPNSELVVIREAGHSLHREKPQEFNPVVLDFLARVEAGQWGKVAAR